MAGAVNRRTAYFLGYTLLALSMVPAWGQAFNLRRLRFDSRGPASRYRTLMGTRTLTGSAPRTASSAMKYSPRAIEPSGTSS